MIGMYSAIPEELRALKNWCLWKYVKIEGKKPTKVPYQPNGHKCNVTDPKTFSDFNTCFNVLALGNYDGLGFIFTGTPYSGIDLDDPTYLADGVTPNPNYQLDLDRQIRIAQEFDSYSEISPSGKGLHIYVGGKVSDGKRTNYIELYPEGRYFTVTGNAHNPKPIKDYQELLTQLWAQMGGVLNKAPIAVASDGLETSTDDEIIALAFKHNQSTFEPLASGKWIGDYPSQSEADLAYLNIIAYYTNSRVQAARIYSKSKLAQTDPKRKLAKYVNRTVNTAFDLKVPLVNVDGFKEAIEAKLAVSSNSRTAAFDAVNDSANLSAVANLPSGLLGEIAQFIYAAAPRPVYETALAAAIGLMAGITGRAYNVSGTGLNQYVMLLAMTGTGKEAAAEGIDKLMAAIKMQVPTSTSFIGPSEISSGSGLFKHLANQSQSFISILGEFGWRLQQLSSHNANGAELSLKRMILDLYNKSGANRTLGASAYSKKEDSTGAVQSPAFSILGESVPEKFYGTLNEDMISDGLLPRFLLIEYKGNRPALNHGHSAITPNFILVERLAALAAQCETINHANPRRVINVDATKDAAKLLSDFNEYADNRINSSTKDVIRQLWNRAHIKALKLSALVAVGENMIDPVVSVSGVDWAIGLVQADIAALTIKFEAGEIGGNSGEIKQAQEIIRMINEYIKSPYDKVEKYIQFKSAKLHQDKVIPYVYLNKRLAAVATFRNDKAQATFAIKRAIQNLVDSDRISELGKVWCNEKYGTSQRCFVVKDTSLLDE